MANLLCPKCEAPMRSYERNGVTLDRCTECRGIFLDAGELERLMEAESAYHDEPGRARPEYAYRSGHEHEHEHDDDSRSRRRRGGFLSELLGGGDD